jgi:hypothetical protein
MDYGRELAKLRAARDAEIRALAAEGLKPTAIGRTVGVSTTHVREILNPERHRAYSARRRAYARRHG